MREDGKLEELDCILHEERPDLGKGRSLVLSSHTSPTRFGKGAGGNPFVAPAPVAAAADAGFTLI